MRFEYFLTLLKISIIAGNGSESLKLLYGIPQ